PENLEAQLRLANLQLQDRKYEDARMRANLIISRQRDNVRAQMLLGNTYAHMLQMNDSIGEMNQGFNREPRLLPSYLDLSDSQDSTRQPQPAEEAYRKAAAIAPNAIEPKLALANFFLRSQRNQEAEQQLQSALAADPKSIDANNALAYFYVKNDKLVRAEETYTRLRDTYPGEVRYKLVLADFLAGIGDIDRAMEAHRKLAAENPKDPISRKRLANL